MDEVWRLLEAYHAPIYFSDEAAAAYKAAGLKGYWMGYFASRSAPLGAPGPGVVTATFYNFAPRRVERAIPDAWRFCPPGKVLDARLEAADHTLRRLLGDLITTPEVAEAAGLAVAAAAACPPQGRPLAAAHAALPVPREPHLALWWAASVLREYRGDGHIAALLTGGLDGCEANRVSVAAGTSAPEQREQRGWTEQEWDDATRRLAARGWLTGDGALTGQGRAARAAIEDDTDRLAAPALDTLGPGATRRLTACLRPLSHHIVDSGGAIPFPNAMALPPIRET
ncbi:hypothetical protein ACGFNU_20195 [Spirillospora sp. NPDC048911]|uniref:SCO6745 family protein n=1 Tax=Spirillospora sp. NPDC048911 TaxID=3364527 RepID=UPI0037199915